MYAEVQHTYKRQRRSAPVAAGANEVVQRTSTKSYALKGTRSGKLLRDAKQFVQRWQRIYNYGANNKAYPSTVTFGDNLTQSSRLCINHTVQNATGEPGIQFMPIYLMDITNWRTNGTVLGTNYMVPMKRFGWGAGGNPQWFDVYPQGNGDSLASAPHTWQMEKGPTLNGLPPADNPKALLDWVNVRMMFYGARKHSTQFHVEVVQFKNPDDILFDFAPDGEAFINMTPESQDECLNFWHAECKRLVYHPMDIQMEQRSKNVSILKSYTFKITPDLSNNLDASPPAAEKIFHFPLNRCVNWNWQEPTTNVEANLGDLETAEYETETAANIVAYAHPRARVFLMIRCEDYEPVLSTTKLYDTADPLASNVLSVSATAPNDTKGFVLDNDGSASAFSSPFSVSVPTGAKVSGYQVIGLPTAGTTLGYGVNSGSFSAYVAPTYTTDGTSAYAFEDSPSFDIIVRNSWTILD